MSISTKDPQLQNQRMLNIGEVIVTTKSSEIIWTVLGSCISVIFHVPGSLSIICHAQVPNREHHGYNCFDSCPKPCYKNLPEFQDFKYVSCSIKYMVKVLYGYGINFNLVKTTLIGGASVLKKVSDSKSIGLSNVQVAKEMLDSYSLKINRELTGGNSGYTLWYYTESDKLFVKKHDEQKKFELNNRRTGKIS